MAHQVRVTADDSSLCSTSCPPLPEYVFLLLILNERNVKLLLGWCGYCADYTSVRLLYLSYWLHFCWAGVVIVSVRFLFGRCVYLPVRPLLGWCIRCTECTSVGLGYFLYPSDICWTGVVIVLVDFCWAGVVIVPVRLLLQLLYQLDFCWTGVVIVPVKLLL